VSFLRRFQPIVYVRLEPDLLSVRDVRSGRTVAEPPLVAISRKPRVSVLAVGEAARTTAMTPGVELVNPFKHPRTLFSDFTAEEVVLKGFFKKLFAGRLFVPSPIVILHPKVDPEGGFTQIELRALRELGVGAGGGTVYICLEKRDLTDDELRRLDSGGKLLES
jgi:rod shape-determining protein MreB and related proteins